MVINNRKYFAFSLYTQDGDNVTSYCMHTFWGWAHETGVNPGDWSCYIGARLDANKEVPKVQSFKKNTKMLQVLVDSNFLRRPRKHASQSS